MLRVLKVFWVFFSAACQRPVFMLISLLRISVGCRVYIWMLHLYGIHMPSMPLHVKQHLLMNEWIALIFHSRHFPVCCEVLTWPFAVSLGSSADPHKANPGRTEEELASRQSPCDGTPQLQPAAAPAALHAVQGAAVL